MHSVFRLRAHASRPNLAMADKSRLSVLSLCVRLWRPAGLLRALRRGVNEDGTLWRVVPA